MKRARFLVPAALLAAALLVCALPLRAAAPVAPKTLELGKGPTVVIIHDLASSRLSWMPTARKLIGRYHVVLVDMPGHGDSPLPDPFTLDAAADAFDQVLARQNPDSTVIVGHGMGGMLALLALKAHPGQARGLMAIDTDLKSPIPVDEQMIGYVKEKIDENYDGFLRKVCARQGRDSAQGVAIHAIAAQAPPASVKAYVIAAFTSDATPALKALQVPFQLVETDYLFRDGKSPGTVLRDLGYPDTTTVATRRITNARALVMQDQPDTLATVISQFASQALAKK